MFFESVLKWYNVSDLRVYKVCVCDVGVYVCVMRHVMDPRPLMCIVYCEVSHGIFPIICVMCNV